MINSVLINKQLASKSSISIMRSLLVTCLVVLSFSLQAQPKQPFKVETLVTGLDTPWSLAMLPDGRMLITERSGSLRIVEKDNKLNPQAVDGLPEIVEDGQGGLLDVILHPNYIENGWIYISYSAPGADGFFDKSGTTVIRAKLQGNKLVEVEELYSMKEKTTSGRHFGSRLVFDESNYLYITVGDRGDRPSSQDKSRSNGSVLRLNDDGSIPKDNPFVNEENAHPAIYSYGHRNPQGMAINPKTKEIWTHEHGPQGGDEINIVKKGVNYGWPVITYGANYGLGTKIGEGTEKAGMQQPIHQWTPSIAPSGMAFYNGDKFKDWKGNLLVGALKYQMLVRIELDGNKVVKQHELLKEELGRIRDVRVGRDGFVYLLTDSGNGRLVRLVPNH